MSINIPTFYVEQFSTNVQLLLQQKGSKLRNSVMTGSHVGKQASPVDQIGAVVANKVSTRFAPMSRVDAPTDRRWVFPVDYDLPQLIDSLDKLRLITDPSSAYVQNAVYAMGRAMDDEVISALFGTAKTGEHGATSTVFPAGQQVAANFKAGIDVGLTVSKLLEAKRLMIANQVDLDSDMLFCGVTAKQHDDLMNEVQVVSTDYNSTPVLVDGRVRSFLGINFVLIERLANDAVPYRRVPMWAKSGMHLGVWNDVQTSVTKRNDLQNEPWQVYCSGTFGATRIEEKKVVEIKCLEA